MIEYRIADEIDLPALAELRYSYWQEEGQDSPESSKEAFLKTFSTSVRQALNYVKAKVSKKTILSPAPFGHM